MTRDRSRVGIIAEVIGGSMDSRFTTADKRSAREKIEDEWLDAMDESFAAGVEGEKDLGYDEDEQVGLDPAEKLADRHAWEIAGLISFFDGLYDKVDEEVQYSCLSDPVDAETGEKTKKTAAERRAALACLEWTASEQDDGSVMLAPESSAAASRLEQHSHMDAVGMGPMALTDLLLLAWPDWRQLERAVDGDDGGGVRVRAESSRLCIPSASHGKAGYALKRVGSRYLANYSHWTVCTERTTSPFVVVDVDSSDAMGAYAEQVKRGVLPECSFMIANHQNGHAQFFWVVPASRRASEGAMALRSGIESSLEALLGGDPMFVGNRCQNPFWISLSETGHDVYVPGGADGCRLWSLRALADFMRSAGSWRPFGEPSGSGTDPTGGETGDGGADGEKGGSGADGAGKGVGSSGKPTAGGKTTMLDRIRRGSGDVSTQYDGSDRALNPAKVKFIPVGERQHTLFRIATWLQWHEGSTAKLPVLNLKLCADPLRDREIRQIRKSVRSYYEKHHGKNRDKYARGYADRGKCALAAMFGRRGGLAKTKLQIASRNGNLRMKRDAMVASGLDNAREAWRLVKVEGESKSAASRSMGVSRQAVSGMLARMETRVRDHVVRKAAIRLGWPTADVAAIVGADWAVVAVVRAGVMAVASGEATGKVDVARKALRDASMAVAWLVARCAPRVDAWKAASKLGRAAAGEAGAAASAGPSRARSIARRVDAARLAAEVASTAEAARESSEGIKRAVEILPLVPYGVDWLDERGLARSSSVLREIAHIAWLDDCSLEPRCRGDEDLVVRGGEPASGLLTDDCSWPADEVGAQWLDELASSYVDGGFVGESTVDPLRPIRAVEPGVDGHCEPFFLDYDYGYGEPEQDPEWRWLSEGQDDDYLAGKLDIKPTKAELDRVAAIVREYEATHPVEPARMEFSCVGPGWEDDWEF